MPSSARRRSAALRAVFSLVAIAVSGCSGGGTTASTEPPPTAAPLTRPEPVKDKVLIIGALLPTSGDDATFGRALEAGIRLAVKDANIDGDTTLIVADEGATSADAAAGAAQLIADDADVIIGPASSRRAVGVAPLAVQAEITMCSPTATSAAFEAFTDDGLFVRTIAADHVEMSALAEQIEGRGETSIVMLSPADEYGARLSAALTSELNSRGISVASSIAYEAEPERIAVSAAEALALSPKVVALIGTPAIGSTMLNEIRTNTQTNRTAPPSIFVNGAMRDPAVGRAVSLDQSFLDTIVGVSPDPNIGGADFAARVRSEVPGTPTEYAAYAYDCVILAALAARIVGPDDPRRLATEMIEISRRGSPCADFRSCAQGIDAGLNMDYSGVSTTLDLSSDGEPLDGHYLVFEFNESGRDVTTGVATATRS